MKKLTAILLALTLLLSHIPSRAFANSDYPHFVSGTANGKSHLCFVNDGTYQNATIEFDQNLDSDRNPRFNTSLTTYGYGSTTPIDFTNDGLTVWSTAKKFIAPINTGGTIFINPGYYSIWFNWNGTGIAAPFQVVTDLNHCYDPYPETDYPNFVSGTANGKSYLCFVNDGTYQNATIEFDTNLDNSRNPRYNTSLTTYSFGSTTPMDFANDGITVWSTAKKFIAPINTGGTIFINPGTYSMWFNWASTGIAAPFLVVEDVDDCADPI